MLGRLSLLLALLATPCAADVVFPGYTTGLGNSAVYVLFSDGSDTAVQMTEGASLKAGTYTASDSAIATASLGAGTYSATIRLGDYSSPSASDTVVGVVDRFVWTGSAERDDLAEVYTDTNTTIPATLTTVNGKLGNPSVTLADDIDDVLTATGDAVTQTTAASIRTALGLAAANMDAQFGDVATAADLATLDGVADAIKAVTDLLPDAGALTTLVGFASDSKDAAEAVETKLPAGGKVIAAAGDTITDLDGVGSASGSTAPVLQFDVSDAFTWEIPGRGDGPIVAKNTLRMSSQLERPRIAFDTRWITKARPSTVTNVEVLDDEGAASASLVVADEEDTTNCGVRNHLVMSKVTGCSEAGTYTVRVTFTTADGATLIVSGEIVAP